MHAFAPPLPLATVDAARLAAIEAQLNPHVAWIGGAYLILIAAGLFVILALARRWRRQPPDWDGHVSRLLWRPWGRADAALLAAVLGGLFLLVALLQEPIRSLLGRLPLRAESAAIVLQSLTFHWTGLALVAVLLVRRRIPWRSAFGLEAAGAGRAAAHGGLALLAAIPLLVFYTFLYQGLLRLAGYETSLQEVAFVFAEEPLPAMRLYFVFLSVVLAPLFEEILFRGILLPVLARRFGAGLAVVLVSALFALIHLHIPSVVPLFILSTALCLTYIVTESLLAAIVMHGLFNGLTVLLLMGLGS